MRSASPGCPNVPEQAGRIVMYLLFPVVLCLLPAAILYLWGPAIATGVDFFQNFVMPFE